MYENVGESQRTGREGMRSHGHRRLEKVGEGQRTLEKGKKVGEGWRRLEKIGERLDNVRERLEKV